MKTYLFSYAYRDSVWSLEIKADSATDARLRMGAIGRGWQYDGELGATFPCWMPRWAMNLIIWLKNLREPKE